MGNARAGRHVACCIRGAPAGMPRAVASCRARLQRAARGRSVPGKRLTSVYANVDTCVATLTAARSHVRASPCRCGAASGHGCARACVRALVCAFERACVRLHHARAHAQPAARARACSFVRACVRERARMSRSHILPHSPTHPLTYWPTHILTYSPTRLLAYSPTRLLTYAPIHPLSYSPTQLLTYSPTHPLATQLLTHSATHYSAQHGRTLDALAATSSTRRSSSTA